MRVDDVGQLRSTVDGLLDRGQNPVYVINTSTHPRAKDSIHSLRWISRINDHSLLGLLIGNKVYRR